MSESSKATNLGLVFIKDENLYTSSRQVALVFGKIHKNVLRDIELLKSELPKEFTRLNFELSKYKDASGKKSPEYLLTKDALTILAMGFTGSKAIQFKIAYINAFNTMQDVITKRLYGDGFTLSELKKKVLWKTSDNLFAQENVCVYLLSDVLKYLGYNNLNQLTRLRYQGMLTRIDGRLWAHEEFVKLKIKQRTAINMRNQVLDSCKRITLAEIQRQRFIDEVRFINEKGGY